MEIKVWFLIPFIVLIILWIIAFFVRKSEYKKDVDNRWLFDGHNYVFPEVVAVISIVFTSIFLLYLCIEVIDWQSSIYINI